VSRVAVAAAAVLAAACGRRPAIGACDDDLRGVYRAEAGDERWMVLDDGATLEAYPLFADNAGSAPGAERAPRVLQLERAGRAIAGHVHRRYMQRSAQCDGRADVHVTRCAGDALELVLGEPQPPLTFAPCAWPSPAPTHVARWHRE
jgi:hypothetical protein